MYMVNRLAVMRIKWQNKGQINKVEQKVECANAVVNKASNVFNSIYLHIPPKQQINTYNIYICI